MLQHQSNGTENGAAQPSNSSLIQCQSSPSIRSSRVHDPMSLSTIMSTPDPDTLFKHPSHPRSADTTPSHKPKTPVSKQSPSAPTPVSSRTHSSKRDGAATNGVPKSRAKSDSASKSKLKSAQTRANKREVEQEVANIEAMTVSPIDINDPKFQEAKEQYLQSCQKRTLDIAKQEQVARKRRRIATVNRYHDPLNNFADYTKARYFKAYQSVACDKIQQLEVEEEKERKKDMQRKRRREKALASEWQKRDEAFEKAQNTADGDEKVRLLREVEKHDKKLRSASRLLDGQSPSMEITGVSSFSPNLEGGTIATFHMLSEDNVPSTATSIDSKKSGRSKSGKMRPRKSKAQKLAEKEAAAAGQAALDRGEELPAPPPSKTPRTPATEKKATTQSSVSASPSGRKKPGPKPKALREALAAAAAAAAAAGEDPPDMSVIESQAAAAIQEAAEKKKEAKEAREAIKAAAKAKKESEKPMKQPYSSKGYNALYDHIWKDISRRDIPKVHRIKETSTAIRATNLRKTAQLAGKEARRWQVKTNKSAKDTQARAKRSMREMLGFWKRNERDERDQRKLAEKQELENAKRLEAEREANRQKRKLNFLISQTELYSHFIGKKVRTEELEQSSGPDTAGDAPVSNGVHGDSHPPAPTGEIGAKVTNFNDLDFDNDDESALQSAAMANAQSAIKEAQDRARQFNQPDQFDDGEMNFQNPTSLQTTNVSQPHLMNCTLKEYQLKGLNWLVNLYEQGINGILADEMGLGKTVQSIGVMAYLAEVHNIWGPFLVVTPASTLHNWQQEISKFVPDFKALPYWGTAKDRKVLRKFWDRKHITYTKDSPFHVLITSYQMVVQDSQYFQKMRWQYMILDEAQAIKSSQSSRWKALLQFHCRNRLLLTGTPIQNNMQELWALLHFIMPSLFDSHDEFSDWFSKDIESHAQSNTKLNEDQLRRLHMILKPFMLRRIKKHVQKELGDKVELDVFCDLTYRQRSYYSGLRNKISIMDIFERVSSGSDSDSATLMNLVMQFRKVCNHPDLFERLSTTSPLALSAFGETASFLREGNLVNVDYSARSLISLPLPRLVYSQGGQLRSPGPGNQTAGGRTRCLDRLMNIWSEDYIVRHSQNDDAFSFLRFADTSPAEAARAARSTSISRAIDLSREEARRERLARMRVAYDSDDEDGSEAYIPTHALFLVSQSRPLRALSEIGSTGRLRTLLDISRSSFERSGLSTTESGARPPAWSPPVQVDCSSHAAMQAQRDVLFNPLILNSIAMVPLEHEEQILASKTPVHHFPLAGFMPKPNRIKEGYTHIQVPSMQRFVSDSGKLACLDKLLRELKENGHRVLLYFQMTRMIDMMEEYLTYRGYKYCRLDGSTKMEDRRDTVADFQSKPEIFIFLLSTRAGGLGINLTSADTVIFYDSDWNPTIDSQAMDRAHRLGQTKQVTVYRLITRNTIEERIRKRALQKEEVQRVVITGRAGAGIDFNTRNRDNRAKDMALWLANDDEAEIIEQREREREAQELAEKNNPSPSTKRKKGGAAAAAKAAKPAAALSLEDMYHEGEGHFEDNSNRPSGSGTPIPGDDTPPAPAPRGRRKAGGAVGGKRAKTIKQRLAIADGGV